MIIIGPWQLVPPEIQLNSAHPLLWWPKTRAVSFFLLPEVHTSRLYSWQWNLILSKLLTLLAWLFSSLFSFVGCLVNFFVFKNCQRNKIEVVVFHDGRNSVDKCCMHYIVVVGYQTLCCSNHGYNLGWNLIGIAKDLRHRMQRKSYNWYIVT